MNDKRNARGKVSSSDLMDQMKTIESLLADVAGVHHSSAASDATGWDAGRQLELEATLRRQGDLLRLLTDGLGQFEDRLANRLIEVIQDTSKSLIGSASNENIVDDECPKADAAPVPVDDGGGRQEKSKVPVDQSWNAIRQAVLESAAEEVADSREDKAPVEQIDVAPLEAHQTAGGESGGTIEPVHFDIPEPIDITTVNDQNLRDAILAREGIMRVMASRLRQRIELAAPISTAQLRELADELPEEFRDHARHTLALLDGQLRLTELELSLERARLGRQMSQLEESQAAIRSTARQLGCNVLEDGTLEGTVPTSDGSGTGRRWMRVLGFGR
jgi:hypothetical protein